MLVTQMVPRLAMWSAGRQAGREAVKVRPEVPGVGPEGVVGWLAVVAVAVVMMAAGGAGVPVVMRAGLATMAGMVVRLAGVAGRRGQPYCWRHVIHCREGIE